MQGEVGSVLAFAVLAVVAPLLTTRMRGLRLPVAVVEILLGLALGKSGLNLLTVTPIIRFLSLFGLSYLMFLSGLEIDATQLTRRGSGQPGLTWPIAIAVSVLVVGAGAGLLLGSHHLVHSPLAIGLLIASSAPTIVLPTLREAGRTATRNGQITLRATLVVDILALLGVSLVAGASAGGSHVLFVLVLLVPLLAALLSSRTIRRWWLGHGLESVTAQIAVRGSLAVILLFIAVSQTLGIATVLGAFMAGVIISLVSGEHRGPLQEKMETVGYGYFIPFFFLLLGAQITIAGQFSRILTLGVILLAAFVVMAAVASALMSWAFRSWREGVGSGFLLSTHLSVTVAGTAILEAAHVIDPTVGVTVILASVVSALVFPAIYLKLCPPLRKEKGCILLVGPAERTDPLQRSLARRGAEAYTGQPPAGRRAVEVAVVVGEDSQRNLITAAEVSLGMKPERMVVEVDQMEADVARERGWTPFVRTQAATDLLDVLILTPGGGDLLLGTGGGDVLQVRLEDDRFDRLPLRRLPLPASALIVAIRRERELLVPRGQTVLRQGDVLTVMLDPNDLAEFRRIFPDQA